MTKPASNPRFLIVGTCDFDNFGDLLLMQVTKEYLTQRGDLTLTVGAPFGWDVTGLLDEQPQPYGRLLDEQSFDAIWTVGGGTRGGRGVLELLFRLSAPDDLHQAFEKGTHGDRDSIINSVTGTGEIVCPHIPAPLEYPPNADTVTVVNSLELFPILGADSPAELSPTHRESIQIISLLRGTTLLSVRDLASSQLLTALDIEHSLAPDVVHALGLLHPASAEDSDIAVLQFKSRFLETLGTAEVAKAIVESEHLKGLRLRILQAGVLRGDDGFDESHRLLEHMRAAAPEIDVQLLRERQPMDLVDHIRRARVVIGTSHHLRVIASAYRRPRVSFGIVPTVTRYARHWDPDMPYGVGLSQLDRAVGSALSGGAGDGTEERADELAHQALTNLEALMAAARDLVDTQNADDRRSRLTGRRRLLDSTTGGTADEVRPYSSQCHSPMFQK